MPVRQDPFRISLEERFDFLQSLVGTANQLLPRHTQAGGRAYVEFCIFDVWRQERALATTEGTYVTQTVYRTGGEFPVQIYDAQGGLTAEADAKGLIPSGRGWEIFSDAQILAQLPALVAEGEKTAALSARSKRKPVEVGRYDVVCDATTMAGVVDATFGRAAEVDRALGYEANASGTSYLGPDPLACLGTSIANSLVNVTASRSLAGGLATVQWDDEGVVPDDFSLVKGGTLVDYQTTREQAAWLAPWYVKQNRPIRSHGCANSESALAIPMQMTPNLALMPSASSTTLDDLIAGVSKGVAILSAGTNTDFQARNGTVAEEVGQVYEITNGKLTAVLDGAAMLFNSSEFWKNITVLGGGSSAEHAAFVEKKGEPGQSTYHTVSAVPAVLRQMSIIDADREA